jgi:hypothetical protein
MNKTLCAAAVVLTLVAAVPTAGAAGSDQAEPSGSAGSMAEQIITGTVKSVDNNTGATRPST